MKKAKDVLEKVYCDGQISGAKSTAKTNYASVDEALKELKELMPSVSGEFINDKLKELLPKDKLSKFERNFVAYKLSESIHKLINERLD